MDRIPNRKVILASHIKPKPKTSIYSLSFSYYLDKHRLQYDEKEFSELIRFINYYSGDNLYYNPELLWNVLMPAIRDKQKFAIYSMNRYNEIHIFKIRLTQK